MEADEGPFSWSLGRAPEAESWRRLEEELEEAGGGWRRSWRTLEEAGRGPVRLESGTSVGRDLSIGSIDKKRSQLRRENRIPRRRGIEKEPHGSPAHSPPRGRRALDPEAPGLAVGRVRQVDLLRLTRQARH